VEQRVFEDLHPWAAFAIAPPPRLVGGQFGEGSTGPKRRRGSPELSSIPVRGPGCTSKVPGSGPGSRDSATGSIGIALGGGPGRQGRWCRCRPCRSHRATRPGAGSSRSRPEAPDEFGEKKKKRAGLEGVEDPLGAGAPRERTRVARCSGNAPRDIVQCPVSTGSRPRPLDVEDDRARHHDVDEQTLGSEKERR